MCKVSYNFRGSKYFPFLYINTALLFSQKKEKEKKNTALSFL